MSGRDGIEKKLDTLRQQHKEEAKIRRAERAKHKQQLLTDMDLLNRAMAGPLSENGKALYFQALATMHVALERYTRDD